MSTRTRGAVACCALFVLVTGCSEDAVPIEDVALTETERASCEDFLDGLPATLADEPARAIEPTSAPGAAWGDPAIVLTCGVTVPDDFDEFASCEEAGGVGWYVPLDQIEDPAADVTMTAAGYEPVVRVDLPSSYRPAGAAAVLAQLAAPVKAALELVQPCL